MQDDWSWAKEYYSQEAQHAIDERRQGMPPQVVEQGQRDWTELIAAVEDAAARGVDPSSAEAQSLAARWRALIGQFTMGNPEVARGLNRLWTMKGCNGSGAVDGD